MPASSSGSDPLLVSATGRDGNRPPTVWVPKASVWGFSVGTLAGAETVTLLLPVEVLCCRLSVADAAASPCVGAAGRW